LLFALIGKIGEKGALNHPCGISFNSIFVSLLISIILFIKETYKHNYEVSLDAWFCQTLKWVCLF